ncbi:MAG: glycosyltransferase [Clostridiales bacterium]|nr:glycosyltransferase [Clostridiales bacterium]
MYINTYIVILLWIFAIFGFIYFILCLLNDLYRVYKSRHGSNMNVIITAKNQQDIIEGIVRDFMLKTGVEGTEDNHFNIILVDSGSNDDTSKIMERLADEYCCVKLVRPGDLCKFIDNLTGWQG